MFESVEKRRQGRLASPMAIVVGAAGVVLAFGLVFCPRPPDPASPPPIPEPKPALVRFELPGMTLDVPGTPQITGDYLMGEVAHSTWPFAWHVLWQPGEAPEREQVTRYAEMAARDLAVGDPSSIREVTTGGARGHRVDFAPEKGMINAAAMLTCGGRVVDIRASAHERMQEYVTKMIDSFRCTPDPDQEIGREHVAVEMRPGWGRSDATGQSVLINERGIAVGAELFRLPAGSTLTAATEAQLHSLGFVSSSHQPEKLQERLLWRGSVGSTAAAVLAFSCDRERMGMVTVFGAKGASLQSGIDLATTARCLAPDEDAPPYPVVGQPAAEPVSTPPRCPAEMIGIPAGRFQMGAPDNADESPHEVTLSAYCIDRTEVTEQAYTACVAAKECAAVDRAAKPDCTTTGPSHPATCIDWRQAARYCKWARKRLPFEAEWEYAARGTDGREYPWGNEPPAHTHLNACGTEVATAGKRKHICKALYASDDGWPETSPVGSYPTGASPFGVLDLAGNVWEWTADWYGAYPAAPRVNPRGMKTGTDRVLRGGAWIASRPMQLRSTYRLNREPHLRVNYVGFRCASTP